MIVIPSFAMNQFSKLLVECWNVLYLFAPNFFSTNHVAASSFPTSPVGNLVLTSFFANQSSCWFYFRQPITCGVLFLSPVTLQSYFLPSSHEAELFFANQSMLRILFCQPITLLYFFSPTSHVTELLFFNQSCCCILFRSPVTLQNSFRPSIKSLLHDFSLRAIREEQTFRRFRVWLAQYITEPHSL